MSFVHQAALRSALRWLRAGQDVHLTGDVGSGCSTVLRALADALREAGGSVVEVSGAAGGDSVPFGALLTQRTLRPSLPGAQAGPRPPTRPGARETADLLTEALEGRGAALLVEDVHLVDRPSLAVIDTVARQQHERVRVVTTVPLGVPAEGPWPVLTGRAAAVRVPPLGVHEVSILLSECLDGQVEGGLAASLTARSGGNPRAAVALAVAAAGTGAISRVHGRWAQTANFETVPTEAVVLGLLGGLPEELRRDLETLAWFGLLDVTHARALLGSDRLAALDAAGRIAVDERPEARLVAVSPPVLAHALRAQLSGARRALLRARAEELFGGSAPHGEDDGEQSPVGELVGPPSPADLPAQQQVTILTESVRTRAALWAREWESRHDVASALPLLRLHLVDGLATADPAQIFANTAAGQNDNPDEVIAYAMVRATWTAQNGGTVRDGVLHDPGPSCRLVVDDLGDSFLDYLEGVYGEPGRAPGARWRDADAIEERDVPAHSLDYATVERVRSAVETGAPDRALDLMGGWQGSTVLRSSTHRLDSLRGDALLMVGQVDDAVAWARDRLSAAYDQLSPFGVRLAARGLSTALFLKGDHDRARRSVSLLLRLGRCGPTQSPHDERIFAIGAVLHALAGHHELARALLDELERTPRPYVPVLDFMRPWARMEVEHAVSGGDPDGEPLWAAGESLWDQGRTASALFCWALTPQRLTAARLGRLEKGFASTHVPLLAPVVRLHQHLADGSSAEILRSLRAVRTRLALSHVALTVAQQRAVEEGGPVMSVEDVAEAAGVPSDAVARATSGPASGLTAREQEIVDLVRLGLANREIASRLYLSVRTVESHLYRAMQKLGASDRRQLIG